MSETITPEKIEEMLAQASFHRFCEPKVISLDESAGTLTIKVPMRDEFERVTGSKQWHGGVMAALVDIAGDLALAIVYGGPIPTINLRIDYLRPAIDTDLTATGKVRRAGTNDRGGRCGCHRRSRRSGCGRTRLLFLQGGLRGLAID